MNVISNQIESILTKQQLEKDYIELKSLSKIAKKYGISDVPIRARFVKYNIPFISKNQRNKCNHNLFSKDSEVSFYLAGFLAADGCIRITKTNRKRPYINNRVVIGLSIKDEEFLKNIKVLLGSTHKLNYYTNKLSKYSDDWNDSKSVKLSITSKQIAKDLKRFNIVPRKSLIYKFPKWLQKHPLLNHFMRGYFDGDGTVYFPKDNHNIVFGVRGTLQFLNNYKRVLKRECKITTKANPTIENGIGNFRIHSNVMVAKVADFIYKNATIFLPRKYEIIKQIITDRNLK